MGIIAKQSIKGTIWTYIGVLVGVITVFLVQSRLPLEMGLARVLVDAATIFIGLAQMGTSSSIIRFFPHFKEQNSTDDKQNYHGFFFWSIIVPLVGFMIFAFIFWGLHTPIQHLFADKSPLFVDYYYFILPLSFFFLYQTIFETNCNVLMHIVFPRAIREVVTRVGLLVTYLLYYFEILSIDGFVICLCGIYAICAICNILYFFSLGHISLKPDFKHLNKDIVKDYLFYTGFMLLAAAVSVFAPTLSSFFVAAKLGLEETGIFAIATYIAVMICIPSRAMNAISQPQLAQSIKDKDTLQVGILLKQVSGNLFLVGMLLFIAIWVNIDIIFHVIPNGETYATAKNVVFILGLSQLSMSAFGISYSAINYSKFYFISLAYSLLLTISSVVLNNYLIPKYGIDGAALANLFAYILYYLLLLISVRLVLHTSLISISHLKTLTLAMICLLINYFWIKYISFYLSNIWIDTLLRNILCLGTFITIAYKTNISSEINALLHTIFIRRK